MNIIVGAGSGKLGTRVVDFACKSSEISNVFSLQRKRSPEMTLSKLQILVPEDFDQFVNKSFQETVIVECGTQDALAAHFSLYERLRLPLIVASTALDRVWESRFKSYAAQAPVLIAPNLSMGVAILSKVLKVLGQLQFEADAHMLDVHHSQKKDAPSGTALKLKAAWGRGMDIQSVRAGTVIGEHQMTWFMEHEQLKIQHIAESRTVFASGAIYFAKKLIMKKPGFYQVEELLT